MIVADNDVSGGGWRRILESLGYLPDRPILIVCSRLADTRLWIEVLNLGGYDLLGTPFEPDELERVTELAHEAWIRAASRSARRLDAEEPDRMALVSGRAN